MCKTPCSPTHKHIHHVQRATTADEIYIQSRILFFCTVSGPTFVQTMVEEECNGRVIVSIIEEKLEVLRGMVSAGTNMAVEAMTDLLKLGFNILVHYPKLVPSEPQTEEAMNPDEPKVMGDFWNSKLDRYASTTYRPR